MRNITKDDRYMGYRCKVRISKTNKGTWYAAVLDKHDATVVEQSGFRAHQAALEWAVGERAYILCNASGKYAKQEAWARRAKRLDL